MGNELSPDKKPFRKWLLLVPTNDLTAAVSVQAPGRRQRLLGAVVRTALASLTLRAKVPDTDYLQAHCPSRSEIQPAFTSAMSFRDGR